MMFKLVAGMSVALGLLSWYAYAQHDRAVEAETITEDLRAKLDNKNDEIHTLTNLLTDKRAELEVAENRAARLVNVAENLTDELEKLSEAESDPKIKECFALVLPAESDLTVRMHGENADDIQD